MNGGSTCTTRACVPSHSSPFLLLFVVVVVVVVFANCVFFFKYNLKRILYFKSVRQLLRMSVLSGLHFDSCDADADAGGVGVGGWGGGGVVGGAGVVVGVANDHTQSLVKHRC